MESSRPPIPTREEYGALAGEPKGDPLEWDMVDEWLRDARYYWLATARLDGRPHVIAIWAVWSDNRIYFTTSPETVTARILAANPNALVHLESAEEVAIVEGRCTRLGATEVPGDVVDAYATKYDDRIAPGDEGMPYFELRPSLILAWRLPDVRGTARKWRFG